MGSLWTLEHWNKERCRSRSSIRTVCYIHADLSIWGLMWWIMNGMYRLGMNETSLPPKDPVVVVVVVVVLVLVGIIGMTRVPETLNSWAAMRCCCRSRPIINGIDAPCKGFRYSWTPLSAIHPYPFHSSLGAEGHTCHVRHRLFLGLCSEPSPYFGRITIYLRAVFPVQRRFENLSVSRKYDIYPINSHCNLGLYGSLTNKSKTMPFPTYNGSSKRTVQ